MFFRRPRLPRRHALTMLLLLLGLSASHSAVAQTVRYPRFPREIGKVPEGFNPSVLLKEALRRANPGLTAVPYDYAEATSTSRVYREAIAGKNVDVIWKPTTLERERDLLPVRIPIDKGLFGWRVALIRSEDLGEFSKIQNLEQLASKRAGLGFDWADRSIMEANQLPVVTAPHYQLLFGMLQAKRFDYFPRSLAEVGAEAPQYANSGIVIEPSFAIHYPFAVYFFVNRNNAALAEDIRKGLELMLADGSFQKQFVKQHSAILQRLNLVQRHVIELKNPLLPSATPLQRKELWFQPSGSKSVLFLKAP